MRLETSSPQEGLQVSLAAYKSLVSDYALRARQAEEMANVLMVERIPPELMASNVVNRITEHIQARGLERATQYLGVLQTTLMALTNLQRTKCSLTPEQLDEELLTIIKALTITASPSN